MPSSTVDSIPPQMGVGHLKVLPFISCLLIGTLIWFFPHPIEVNPDAWRLLAIFVATIMGIILRPLPVGAVALLAIVTLLITNTLTVEQAFAGFGSEVAWLVVFAFFIAKGFIKTGLGRRLAFLFVRALGRHTLGLGYGLVATDLALAPFIPSVTARAAGILYPIIRSLAQAFDSHPRDPSARKIGAYLLFLSFHGTVVSCAMFMTSMAGNPVIAKLAGGLGVEITWGGWAMAAIVPGLVSLLVLPLVMYVIYPPEIKATPHAIAMAKSELKQMGSMSRDEWIMLGTLGFLLVFWSAGQWLGIASVTTALFGLCVLLITGVLEWQDLLAEQEAWGTFVWFSTLLMMAGFLMKLGLTTWFGEQVVALVRDMDWRQSLLFLVLVYFFVHYFFASITAHIYSLFTAFLAVAIGTGAPPLFAAYVLTFASNLCGGLTHYGTSPAPLLYASGFVSLKDWWVKGAIICVMNLLIWVVVGGAWWRLLGLW